MSGIERLNNPPVGKPTKNFQDLPKGEHFVKHFRFIETKDYGNKIRIELADSYMYLPERYILSDEEIADLNKSVVIMKYLGKDQNNRLLLKFEKLQLNVGDQQQ